MHTIKIKHFLSMKIQHILTNKLGNLKRKRKKSKQRFDVGKFG